MITKELLDFQARGNLVTRAAEQFAFTKCHPGSEELVASVADIGAGCFVHGNSGRAKLE